MFITFAVVFITIFVVIVRVVKGAQKDERTGSSARQGARQSHNWNYHTEQKRPETDAQGDNLQQLLAMLNQEDTPHNRSSSTKGFSATEDFAADNPAYEEQVEEEEEQGLLSTLPSVEDLPSVESLRSVEAGKSIETTLTSAERTEDTGEYVNYDKYSESHRQAHSLDALAGQRATKVKRIRRNPGSKSSNRGKLGQEVVEYLRNPKTAAKAVLMKEVLDRKF